MSKLFRKKLAICWFAVQFLYFAMTTDVDRTGTYWTEITELFAGNEIKRVL